MAQYKTATELLNNTTRGNELLEKEKNKTLTALETIELGILKSSYTTLFQLNSVKDSTIESIAKLKVDISKSPGGVATAEQQNRLNYLTGVMNDTMSKISSLDSSSIKLIEEARKKDRLALIDKLTSDTKALATPDPKNLMEYILRTQSLNPYQRERKCDQNFVSLLQHVGKESGTLLTEFKETLRKLLE